MSNLVYLVNSLLYVVFVFISFFLNYVSSLYLEFDLFKVDLTEELKDKENSKKLFFILKNSNLLFTIICFTQVLINWFFSTSLLGRMEKEILKKNRFAHFVLIFLTAIITEILSRWMASVSFSKEIVTNKIFTWIAYSIMRPFSWMRIIIKPKRRIFINSEKDVIRFINNLAVENILEKKEAKLIQSAFNFDELIVKSVFIKWEYVVFLREEMNYEDIKRIHLRNFLTRYPVLNSRNEIIGIFNMKIFNWRKIMKSDEIWQNCIDRKIVFVSPNEMIDKVFEKIRTENYRMAIVKEKKEVVGIITLQDILVSLVGKMSDEKEKLLPKELVDIK